MTSTDRSHIIAAPAFLLGFRIAQLVVAVAVLGLAAYGVTFVSFDGDALSLFTALASIIIVVYVLAASIALPVAYNYWAILGLDIFAIVFWLISFALLASEVAAYSVVDYTYTDYSCYYYDDCSKKRDLGLDKRATTTVATYRNAMAACAGLGGLEFILFIITLVIFSIHLHRHRAAGGHCMPNSANTNNITTEPKNYEMQQPQNVPVQTQQQPVYNTQMDAHHVTA